MTASICALLGYAAWTIAIVLAIVSYRLVPVLARKTPANSWTRGAQTWQDHPLVTRMSHAHANCVENLPLVAAVILGAHALGQGEVLDAYNLPCVLLGARIAQSTVHMIAVNHWMVFLRANLFGIQVIILVYWLLKLAQIV